MNYKAIYEIFTLFLCLIVSGYLIYIGASQVRRVPFIMSGFSTKAGIVLPGVLIFSSNAVNQEVDMFLWVTTFCLLILFFIFLYLDYKKYYLFYIYNIELETLKKLVEEYFKAKDIQVKVIQGPSIIDSLYNEVRIYKSKSIKSSKDLKRDFEQHINHMKYKEFRVMGLVNILFGIGFEVFFLYIFTKFHL